MKDIIFKYYVQPTNDENEQDDILCSPARNIMPPGNIKAQVRF